MFSRTAFLVLTALFSILLTACPTVTLDGDADVDGRVDDSGEGRDTGAIQDQGDSASNDSGADRSDDDTADSNDSNDQGDDDTTTDLGRDSGDANDDADDDDLDDSDPDDGDADDGDADDGDGGDDSGTTDSNLPDSQDLDDASDQADLADEPDADEPDADEPPYVGLDDPCSRDGDCIGTANICILEEGDATLDGSCQFEVGSRGAGDICTSDSQCQSGICYLNSFCLAPCVGGGDCSNGTCETFTLTLDEPDTLATLADDTISAIDICFPDDLGSLARCARDGDCSTAGETCALQFNEHFDDGDPTNRCALEDGVGTDARCTSGSQCQSGFCLTSGDCYWPCVNNGDCSAGADCTTVFVGEIRSCLNTCESGDDCGAAQACDWFPNDDPADELVQICIDAFGPDESGTLCDADDGAFCTSDSSCEAGVCCGSSERRCAGPCNPVDDAGCAAGTVCYPNQIYVELSDNETPGDPEDDIYASYSTCLSDMGSFDFCTTESDCSGGETCTLLANGTVTGLEFRCITPVGAGAGGDFCSAGSDCRTGICLGGNTCFSLCGLGEGPCGVGICITVEFTYTIFDIPLVQNLDICSG